MPDPSGKMYQPEKDAAAEWLKLHEALLPCAACGFRSFVITDHVVHLQTSPQFLGGVVFPAVVVMCKRCAFFRLHSAIVMGIVKSDTEAADEAAPSQSQPDDADTVKANG